MSSQHTADAGDGEAVYSSDALPPVPVPPPPPFIALRTEDDILDSESIPANQAIEAFRHGGESRLEKLDRIKKELKALESEKDLNGSSAVVQELQEKLEMLMGGSLWRQTELTKVVASSGGNPTQETEMKRTHEKSSAIQEERLLRIEQMIGSDINATSVMERLKAAEYNLESVNETTLEKAASRAKVIRADLEAAAKARGKMNSNAQDAAKVSKLYNQLMELDGFLATDSNVLKAIVDRLSACAELHSKSMEFSRVLDSLESTVGGVTGLLANLEQSVGSLEKGMDENMKVIQSNMENLDKRLG
jgi:hypothetical protein